MLNLRLFPPYVKGFPAKCSSSGALAPAGALFLGFSALFAQKTEHTPLAAGAGGCGAGFSFGGQGLAGFTWTMQCLTMGKASSMASWTASAMAWAWRRGRSAWTAISAST